MFIRNKTTKTCIPHHFLYSIFGKYYTIFKLLFSSQIVLFSLLSKFVPFLLGGGGGDGRKLYDHLDEHENLRLDNKKILYEL